MLFADDRSIVAARVNGVPRDLTYVVEDDDTVEPIAIESPVGRAILRHSTAHVLAQAVQDLFPKAKLGIGPPIENGFYYDFDVPQPFHPDDLDRIEKRMREIVKEGQAFSRRVVSDEEARAELADEPYKLELIGLKGGARARQGADVRWAVAADHLRQSAPTAHGRGRTLSRSAPATTGNSCLPTDPQRGAYWRGSEQQTRSCSASTAPAGVAEALKGTGLLEEADKRDHRKIGADLDLFSFPDEIGSGLPVFHPKGGVIRREMENYSRQRHEEAGYSFVNSPHITKEDLFQTSGHLQWFADGMFPPMEMEGSRYYLKPMNCPFHILIYRSRGRSYRELPLRLFEFGTVYRYEKSGVVTG